jgi:hypothetical protein
VEDPKSGPDYSVFTTIFFFQFYILRKMFSLTFAYLLHRKLKTTGLENVDASTSHINLCVSRTVTGIAFPLFFTLLYLSWSGDFAKVHCDELNEFFFNLRNPSCCVFTQPLTEMSTKSRKIMFLGSRARPVLRADNLTAICGPIV